LLSIKNICRALGIISKTITALYWRCVGDSDINVLHIGSIYEQLIDLLTNGANSPHLLILQFGACFILVSSSPHTLSTDMLFGGHDSDFLAKVSEGLKKLPFSRKF
jgi:hypothetical protein